MNDTRPRSLTPQIWWIGVVAIVATELFVIWWFSLEKTHWSETPRLAIRLTEVAPSHATHRKENSSPELFSFVPQPDRLTGSIEQLSYSKAVCGMFLKSETLTAASPAIDLFYFEYETGNPRFIHDVFGHAPEVCMRSSGAQLRQTHPPRNITVSGQSIPVRVLEFESPLLSDSLWVFRITWLPPDAPYQSTDSASSLRREKLLAAFYRNPRPPARVVLSGAMNFESLESAWSTFESVIGSRLEIIEVSEG
ncbi:MAG: hypothetical protein CMO55_25345 [Verrucomicrobiales bacterium]|nr:hypothetical protein [Verrucomicrobiales bacterium]